MEMRDREEHNSYLQDWGKLKLGGEERLKIG